MEAALQAFLAWISDHPAWSGVVVFLLAMAESLAVVGLFFPGVVLMFGVGAVVGTGAMPLWSTLAWAAAGAAAGDVVSFWLGRHFRQHLKDLWPFRRHPGLLDRGIRFFQRHGGKSVLLGRFVGPLRPVIPAVAGMLHMSAARFVLISVPASLVWSPAYILPGVVFGASLGLAAEVAGRLAALVVALLAILWFTLWLVRRLFLFFQPRAGAMLAWLLSWSRDHPWMGELGAALADPRHPEYRGLAALAAILFLSVWAFFGILWRVAHDGAPGPSDLAVLRYLQGLRTPWADHLMVAVTELGDPQVHLPLAGVVLAWLLVRRSLPAAAHWLAAVGFAALSTQLLKVLLHIPRPEGTAGVLTGYSFPSAHAAMSVTVYGFLAVLVAREMPAAWRWIPYVAAGLLVTPIALSRLYLGAHWPQDVIGGLTLGLVWVAVLGIAYRCHPAPHLSAWRIAAVSLAALALLGAWHMQSAFERDLERYAARREIKTIPAARWWDEGWRMLPAHRLDLQGRISQPLTVQWAGGLEPLARRLEERGWRRPVPLRPDTALRYLSPDPVLANLPVPPQVHDGRHERLTMLRETHDPGRLWVLRLWPADVVLAPGDEPLWIGYAAPLGLARPLALFAFPRTGADFTASLEILENTLEGFVRRRVRRGAETGGAWDGTVLLVRAPRPGGAATP